MLQDPWGGPKTPIWSTALMYKNDSPLLSHSWFVDWIPCLPDTRSHRQVGWCHIWRRWHVPCWYCHQWPCAQWYLLSGISGWPQGPSVGEKKQMNTHDIVPTDLQVSLITYKSELWHCKKHYTNKLLYRAFWTYVC